MRPDLTSLCTTCAVRYARDVTVCPVCGGEMLAMTKPRDRARAREELAMRVPKRVERTVEQEDDGRRPSGERLKGLLATLFPGAGIAAGGVLVASGDRVTGLLVVLVSISVTVWVVSLVFSRRRRGPHRVATRIAHRVTRPAPPPVVDGVERGTRVEGVVRTRGTLRSPLTETACAAFRVRGATQVAELDDAGVTTFDVVTAEGEEVAVAEGGATVELEVGETQVMKPHGALRAFLKDRGALADGPGRFAESLLRDGDEVVVEGAVESHVTGDTYRGTRDTRSIVEAPGIPRVIRRVGRARGT